VNQNNDNLMGLLLSAEHAADLLDVSVRHFYALHSSGRLGPLPIRLGRRTLWRRSDLEAWVQNGCPAREKWESVKKMLQPSAGGV